MPASVRDTRLISQLDIVEFIIIDLLPTFWFSKSITLVNQKVALSAIGGEVRIPLPV